MKPCPCCSSMEVGQIIGVQYGINDIRGVAFLCPGYDSPCGTYRVRPWADAEPGERHEAILAEKARIAQMEGAV